MLEGWDSNVAAGLSAASACDEAEPHADASVAAAHGEPLAESLDVATPMAFTALDALEELDAGLEAGSASGLGNAPALDAFDPLNMVDIEIGNVEGPPVSDSSRGDATLHQRTGLMSRLADSSATGWRATVHAKLEGLLQDSFHLMVESLCLQTGQLCKRCRCVGHGNWGILSFSRDLDSPAN